MASSVAAENLEFEGMEGVEGMEVLGVDKAFMRELLEETYVEEVEDDKAGALGNVIRSFEAEIGELGDLGRVCLGEYESFDWSDMEIVDTSFSEDVGQWYVYSLGDEFVGVDGYVDGSGSSEDAVLSQTFRDLGDLSQFCYEEGQDYCSLWQETYDPSVYRSNNPY